MRVTKSKIPEHQEDRNSHSNWRHHPRAENEEQKIILERHLEPTERIGGQGAKKDAQKRGPKPDYHRVHEAFTKLGRPDDHHVILAHDIVRPVLWRVCLQKVLSLPRPRCEQVDVSFQRRVEHDLGRVADGICGRLENRSAKSTPAGSW